MEHLNKQQIILLTLLVSFVTSIATGIVTVALMDQAPIGVTSTINRVIERTIEAATPNGNTSGQASTIASGDTSIDSQDLIPNAISKVEKSLVKIKHITGVDGSGNHTSVVTGIGIVVSKTGIVVSDKSSVAVLGNYVAVLPDNQEFPFQVIQSQNDGDLVFLSLNVPAEKKSGVVFTPAVLASSKLKLGQSILSLSGSDTFGVDQGIVKKINTNASSTAIAYLTDINSSDTLVGSPLFDTSGAVFGLKTLSLQLDQAGSAIPKDETDFYPISVVRNVVPSL